MDREDFLKGMEFCRTHANCAQHCPLHDKCRGAYDMLYGAFDYIKELTQEKERNDECSR